MSAESTPLRIELLCSPAARQIERLELTLPAGATVIEALRQAGWLDEPAGRVAAIWGRHVEPDQPLRDGDRVEWLRALTVDPKEARRQRYRGHSR